MTPEDFAQAAGVSRETLDRLGRYAALLVKWQKAVNLVSAKTLPDLWRRHMLDSAQLWPFIPADATVLIDLGSGAGFPGLVLAILAIGREPPLLVHLVESDQKKAAFLREAARATGAQIEIHAARIETLKPIPADVITARALASMSQLKAWTQRFAKQHTVCLFLKGQDIENELTELADFAKLEICFHPSLSDQSGRIVELHWRH